MPDKMRWPYSLFFRALFRTRELCNEHKCAKRHMTRACHFADSDGQRHLSARLGQCRVKNRGVHASTRPLRGLLSTNGSSPHMRTAQHTGRNFDATRPCEWINVTQDVARLARAPELRRHAAGALSMNGSRLWMTRCAPASSGIENGNYVRSPAYPGMRASSTSSIWSGSTNCSA